MTSINAIISLIELATYVADQIPDPQLIDDVEKDDISRRLTTLRSSLAANGILSPIDGNESLG